MARGEHFARDKSDICRIGLQLASKVEMTDIYREYARSKLELLQTHLISGEHFK